MGGDIVPVQPQSNYYEYYDANDGGAYGGAAPEQGYVTDAAYAPAAEPTHAAHQPLDPHAGKETVHLQFETQADDNQNDSNDSSEARTQAEADAQNPPTADQAEPVALDEVNTDTVTQPPAPAAGASITPDGDGQFKADHPVQDPTEIADAKVAELGKVVEGGNVPTETGAGRIHEVAADMSLGPDEAASTPPTPTTPPAEIVNHDKAAATEPGSELEIEPTSSHTAPAPLPAAEMHVSRANTSNSTEGLLGIDDPRASEQRTGRPEVDKAAVTEVARNMEQRSLEHFLHNLVDIAKVAGPPLINGDELPKNHEPYTDFIYRLPRGHADELNARTIMHGIGGKSEVVIIDAGADDSMLLIEVPYSAAIINQTAGSMAELSPELKHVIQKAAEEKQRKDQAMLDRTLRQIAADERSRLSAKTSLGGTTLSETTDA